MYKTARQRLEAHGCVKSELKLSLFHSARLTPARQHLCETRSELNEEGRFAQNLRVD